MLKNSKIFFYIKHLMLMASTSKIRVALTSLGIFVAVFLLATGSIISDSYYNSQFDTVADMDDCSIIVASGKYDDAILQHVQKNLGGNASTFVNVIGKKSIFTSKRGSGDRYLTVMANVYGISDVMDVLPVSDDNGNILSFGAKPVEGRLLTWQDIFEKKPVAVIDKLTADIISPGGSCLGKTLTLGGNLGGVAISSESGANVLPEVTVVGVIESPNISDARKIKAEREQRGGEKNIIIDASIYCPASFLADYYTGSDAVDKSLICSMDSREQYRKALEYVREVSGAAERAGSRLDYTTTEAVRAGISETLLYTKTLIGIVIAVLCVISGISIVGIIFFSIKERIPEIGIRKAFGAGKADIAFQLTFENVIVSFFASVVAVIVSFYACKIVEVFVFPELFVEIKIHVRAYQLIMPVLVGVIEAFVCSLIPAIYAANIKATDALKFE